MSTASARYDSQKLTVLADLRRDAGISQSATAVFFGLANRDSVSAWELGESRPHYTRRSRFIVYLWDKLRLSRQPKKFLEVWNDVMVEEWRWKPLGDGELPGYFPRTEKQIVQKDSNTIERVLLTSEPQTVPFLAPPRPPYKPVGRDNLLRDLKQQLFISGNLALNGLPGVGKTALAVELAHDSEVLAHFSDGVLWAGLGRKGDVLSHLGIWCAALGIPSDEITELIKVDDRMIAIRTAIGMRRMLLVVDDAWETDTPHNALEADPSSYFKVGGPNCAYLVTTRFPKVAVRFAGGGAITVHELSEADGLNLLEQLASEVVKTEGDEAQELVTAVGGLPLALVLMGNYLRTQAHSGQPRRIRQALDKLKQVQERLHLAEPQSAVQRHPSLPEKAWISVEAVIAVSDEALDDRSRQTLRALSIFPPKPNSFSEEAAMAVSATPMEALNTLYDYGLLESAGPGRYTLHQTIADYGKSKITNTAPYERMVEYSVRFLETHQRDYSMLDLELNNLLAALETAYDLWKQASSARRVRDEHGE